MNFFDADGLFGKNPAGDEFVLALPQFVDRYRADIRVRIVELRAEIRKLELM